MSAINESGFQAFTAGADLAAHRRVKRGNAGEVVYAMASDGNNWIGVTIHDKVIGRQVTVRLRNSPGTFFFTANSVIADTLQLKVADDGKVDNASTGVAAIPFQANEAASADGDVIEALPFGHELSNPAVLAQTSATNNAANATDLASTEALANANKAQGNALVADILAIRTALANAGITTLS